VREHAPHTQMSDPRGAAEASGRSAFLLLPRPKRLVATGGRFALPREIAVCAPDDATLRADLERFGARIAQCGSSVAIQSGNPAGAHVRIAFDRSASDRAGGYRLIVGSEGVDVAARDASGAWHALCTLAQLVAHAAPSVAERPMALP